MARIRADYVFGTTTAALTAADSTLASAELTRLPAVTGSDIAAVTLHDSTTGTYEIVHVTAHTAAATTATILRGREGSTAASWASGATWLHGLTVADVNDIASASAASGTGIIGYNAYSPATQANYSINSTTFADIDATNLLVTFTAPSTGRVLVSLSGLVDVNAANASWGLRSGTTTVPATPMQIINGQTGLRRTSADIAVTGLTGGTSYTYKWAWKTAGSTATMNMYAGGTGDSAVGAAVMSVYALP